MKKMIRKFVGFTTSLSMLLYPLQLHATDPAPEAAGDPAPAVQSDIVVNPNAIHPTTGPTLQTQNTDLSDITGLSPRTEYVTPSDKPFYERLAERTSNYLSLNWGIDYCFSCTVTRYGHLMKSVFPLSGGWSLLSPVNDELSNTEANQCIANYEKSFDDNAPQVKNPTSKMCNCLQGVSAHTPLITEEDLKKYEKEVLKDNTQQLKEHFAEQADNIVADYNKLSSAIFYDRNFNVFSKTSGDIDSEEVYEQLGRCQVDFSFLMDQVFEENPSECTEEGARAMKNIAESASAKKLLDLENKTNDPFMTPATKEAWNKLSEVLLTKGSTSNNSTNILRVYDSIKSLNFSPEAIDKFRDEMIKHGNVEKSLLEAGEFMKMTSTSAAFSPDLANTVQEFVHSAPAMPPSSSEPGGRSAAQVADLVGDAKAMGEAVSKFFKPDVSRNISLEVIKGVSSGNVNSIDRNLLHKSNIAFFEMISRRARYSAGPDNTDDLAKLMHFLISKQIPHTSFALQSSLLNTGHPMAMSEELDVNPSTIDYNDMSMVNSRLDEMRNTVCNYPKFRSNEDLCGNNPRKPLNRQNMLALFGAVDMSARRNVVGRCGVASEKMLNYCRAFSNKKPKATAEDGIDFLRTRFTQTDPSPFSPPAKNLEEHKLKVAQLGCFLSLRDKITDPNIESMDRCDNAAKLFFRDDAISHLNSTQSGLSCKELQGSFGGQTVALGTALMEHGADQAVNPDAVMNKITEQVARDASSFSSSRSYGPARGYQFQRDGAGSDQFSSNTGKAGAISSSLSGEVETNKTVEQKEEKPTESSTNQFAPINPYDFKPDEPTASRSVAGSRSDEKIDDEIRDRDRKITTNNSELDALKARLAEAERKLSEATAKGDKTAQDSMQALIAQLQADRKKMQEENDKMKAEVREMLSDRSSRANSGPVPADIKRIGNRVGFLPATATPTPSSSSGGIVSNKGALPKSQDSGLGGSSFSGGNVSVNRGGLAAKGPDDFGFQRQQVMTLSAGELTSARFVAADKKAIFSSILSKPSEPVFVRENGMIVKYVAQLDEEGKPLLDKDGNPILKEYLFTDPEAEKKVVDKKTEPKKPEPKKDRKPAASWEKALEDLKSGSGN